MSRPGATWLADWEHMITDYGWGAVGTSTAAGAWRTFYEQTGKGYIAWAQGWYPATGTEEPPMRITVDGNAFTLPGGNRVDIRAGTHIPVPIPFEASVKIELRNERGVSADLVCQYTVLRVSSAPRIGRSELANAGSVNVAYHSTGNTALQNVVDTGVGVSGYVLLVEQHGTRDTADGDTHVEVLRDGTNIVLDTAWVFDTVGSHYRRHRFYGPLRFTDRLRVRHKVAVAGVVSKTRVIYSVDS